MTMEAEGRTKGALRRTEGVTGGRITGLATALALLGATFALAEQGQSVLGAGFATIAQVWVESGGVAVAWFVGAVGLGRIIRGQTLPVRSAIGAEASSGGEGGTTVAGGVVGGSGVGWTVQMGAGVALMLMLAHAAGALGAWSGAKGVWLAWAPVLIGVGALVGQIRRRDSRPELLIGVSPAAMLAIPGLAVLIVAACLAPGTMWASEAHGYDALSYHLQLPREWLERGRIESLGHNVYSCLPSFVEASFAQMGAMMGRGSGAFTEDAGRGVFAAQTLSALLALATALAVGRLVTLLVESIGGGGAALRGVAGSVAGAAVLLTPWVAVVGSMAYDETAVTLMLSVALIVARAPGLRAAARGALVGVLMGAAVGSKLTAAYMAGPVVVIALLASLPRREWSATLAAAGLAGAAGLAPWLIRNGLATGNPVFPFATGVFGAGWWTAEQVSRWSGAHHEAGGVLRRFALTLGAERGVLHHQWFVFFPMALAAGAVAAIDRRTRMIGVVGLVMLGAQVVAWMSFGHVQSRFLLPAVVTGAVLWGVGAWTALTRGEGAVRKGRGRMVWVVVMIPLVALGVGDVMNYLGQNNWRAGAALVGGTGLGNGSLARDALRILSPEERVKALGNLPASALVNLALGGELGGFAAGRSSGVSWATPLVKVYLLGDATPFYFRVPTVYHTTWDASPLGEGLRRHGGDLKGALDELRRSGVTHALVNLDEVARLRGDGWSEEGLTVELGERVVREGGEVVWRWTDGGRRRGSYLVDLTRPGG